MESALNGAQTSARKVFETRALPALEATQAQLVRLSKHLSQSKVRAQEEMALTPEELIAKVLEGDYQRLFRPAFGCNFERYAVDHAYIVYNDIALAIAAFERSTELKKFGSKFDQFVNEQKRKGIDVSQIAMEEANEVVDGWGRRVASRVFMS